jgi:hypothetical protein
VRAQDFLGFLGERGFVRFGGAGDRQARADQKR